MSRLLKTRGIVIRHSPYSETSRIVQWITEDHGRLVTIAKGAMRPRSSLLGQFDSLYTCELIFYAHEREAVYVTREIATLHARPRLRTDWRAALAGAYLADLVARVVPRHESVPELFALLEQALDEFHDRGWHAPTLFLAELRLLHQLGLAPRLDACAVCDRRFAAGEPAAFSSRRGGMTCPSCPASPDDHRVGADVLAMLRFWQNASGWNTARTARCSPAQLATIQTLLGDFLAYHLDIAGLARARTLHLTQSVA